MKFQRALAQTWMKMAFCLCSSNLLLTSRWSRMKKKSFKANEKFFWRNIWTRFRSSFSLSLSPSPVKMHKTQILFQLHEMHAKLCCTWFCGSNRNWKEGESGWKILQIVFKSVSKLHDEIKAGEKFPGDEFERKSGEGWSFVILQDFSKCFCGRLNLLERLSLKRWKFSSYSIKKDKIQSKQLNLTEKTEPYPSPLGRSWDSPITFRLQTIIFYTNSQAFETL